MTDKTQDRLEELREIGLAISAIDDIDAKRIAWAVVTLGQLREDNDLLEGEVGSLALLIEQQQAALQLAEEALKAEVDDESREYKIEAALTAIQKLKEKS